MNATLPRMKLLYLHDGAGDEDALLTRDGAIVAQVARLEEVFERLSRERFDAVLLDLTVDDGQGVQDCRRLAEGAPDVPVVAITSDDDETQALDAIAAGAQDYVVKSQFEGGDLAGRIRAALARRVREVNRLQAELRAQSDATHGEVLQRDPLRRYPLARGVWAAGVLPGGGPDRQRLAAGLSVGLDREGLTLELEAGTSLTPGKWVVGLEHHDGDLRFACVEAAETGGLFDARFLAGNRDLFRQRNLTPTFDARTARFTTGLSPLTLDKWVELGVLRPQFFERVLVCPKCGGLPTLRSGCRVCGSSAIETVELMHHFACAHVAPVADFDRSGEITCPKCRARSLVVGADFEYLNGPFQCRDCDWSDANFEWVNQCLGCKLRFPIHQAVEQELTEYHVERLDPLAFLAAS